MCPYGPYIHLRNIPQCYAYEYVCSSQEHKYKYEYTDIF